MKRTRANALAWASTTLILAHAAAALAQPCVPAPAGILAWWPLDEGSGTIANDIAGFHPAAYFGAPQPAAGEIGGALRLNGTSDFLAAAKSDLWAFGNRDFTIELWANFDAPVGGDLHHPGAIFIGNDGGPGGFAKWFFAIGGGYLNFHINGPALGSKFFPLVPFSPQVGRWYHLGVTRNGALYTMYIDGAPAGSAVNRDTIPDPAAPLTIGQAESLGFVHGRLDEVTVYDRALTQAEMKAVFAAGSAGKCRAASTAAISITPATGGDTGPVTVRITGHGFAAGTAVKLVRAGSPDIPGTAVQIADSLTLSTTFDLTGQPRGDWDLVVANPDGSVLTFRQGFTIEPGRGAQPWVQIVGRGAIRAGRPTEFQVLYGNRGNVDARWVPMSIGGIPRDASYQLGADVSPPPIPGTDGIDWSKIPISIDTPQGFAIPLLVSTIPPGTISSLHFSIRVPAPEEFDLSAAVGRGSSESAPAVGGSHSSSANDECLLAFIHLVLAGLGLSPEDECAKALAVAAAERLSALVTGLVEGRSLLALVPAVTAAIVAAAKETLACAGKEILKVAAVKIAEEVALVAQAAIVGWYVGVLLDKCAPVVGAGVVRVWRSLLHVRGVGSHDPNDFVGAPGVGSSRYVPGAVPLPYEAIFENVATASAPAQQVVIEVRLDSATLDLRTLRLGPITLAGRRISPPPGAQAFSASLDLRPARSLIVAIEANLDATTGLLSWRFTSIDPATGQPPVDPLAGFLPPNVHPPEGEGSVLFTVMSRGGLPTGTEIRNHATVTFDSNPPIDTPEWRNTIDNSKPSSQVSALAPRQTALDFQVQWSGSDVGSGIQDYTIFVSASGGPYSPWLANTTSTSATFHGLSGTTYSFYSVARDWTNNLGDPPAAPDATTQVEILPPVIRSISPASGPTAGGTPVTITGAGFASGATVKLGGVAVADLQVGDATTLTATTGPHATGAVDVAVTNPDGLGATLARSFFYSPPDVGLDFFTLTPCRVIDTRRPAGPLGGPPLAPFSQRIFTVTETCGIPPSARALAVNFTVVSPAAGGDASLFPGNAFFFGASMISFSSGQTRATNGIVSLATDGTGSLGFINGSSGSVHLVLDVSGYFE
ncbi:MAG TPA: LamG-like jellyroll fold domain-containing protein [Thermoanaerobaculia bacterium]|nr:LamG-like jellyroll fold domain-containing protein [Thermoanaerobaculia bacterium]